MGARRPKNTREGDARGRWQSGIGRTRRLKGDENQTDDKESERGKKGIERERKVRGDLVSSRHENQGERGGNPESSEQETSKKEAGNRRAVCCLLGTRTLGGALNLCVCSER
ncbi:hypothetical protein M408DRAFT_194208 [Serendipita vermifera MAFF 305830]|uniref:Uncharacterized protein n=1 Tax=Serendipita vermifera MAFF 305830 TaxID=933852 RepID=A0A0C2XAN2_SERVB|nr:hypothetical protein M408DRAFT_194208 [Serendipita vermifera MAFF 305830]